MLKIKQRVSRRSKKPIIGKSVLVKTVAQHRAEFRAIASSLIERAKHQNKDRLTELDVGDSMRVISKLRDWEKTLSGRGGG
jgi:hypothetical protein